MVCVGPPYGPSGASSRLLAVWFSTFPPLSVTVPEISWPLGVFPDTMVLESVTCEPPIV